MATIEDLANALLKEIGDNAGNQAPTSFIDTGYPPLNRILSGRDDGGLPYGRMVEMYGDSSTGKTALATKWLVETQRLGGVAGFMDWERSFNVDLAKNFGLNDKRPHWIYAKPKTWEEGNTTAAKACQLIRKSGVIAPEAPILFVFDSIAAALPRSVAYKEIDEYTMNDTTALARVTSSTLKAMAHHAEENNAVFLYLNQTRLKPGVVYGDPTTTPGGRAMEFYSTARLALGRTKIMDTVDGEKQFVGQQISIKCVKNKITKPFQETSIRMSFDENGIAHFDVVASMVDYLIEKGALKYSKPRVTRTDGKQYFIKALVEKLNKEEAYGELLAIFDTLKKHSDVPATAVAEE